MSLIAPVLSIPAGTLASAARSSNGSASTLAAPPPAKALIVWVGATAVTGVLTPYIEWTAPDGVTWITPDPVGEAFLTFSQPGSVIKVFEVRGAKARLSWSVGGSSPSSTFAADLSWLI